ncbi:hypothetical protein BOTBODRAFT_299523 [Botryobasidium botryosum FD-172 SS1]|uniref:Uncharacterized protein n=1 Tax=Botryobasidium botryosum (strain FD-172 SS1) TaxID=930990 RepID=A0A067M1K5_BOTB1|nr:hypothetical protein BOTBODRAFT_299523 [Botryobasidium botryosum FD-172 SS1]
MASRPKRKKIGRKTWMIRRCNATTPTKLDDAKTPIEYPANGQVEWLRPRKLSAKQLMRRDKIKDHAKLRQAAIDAFAKEGVEPIACRIDQKQTDLLWEQIGQEEQKKYLKQADEQRATHVNFGDQKGFAEDLVKHVEMWLSLTQRRLPAGYALGKSALLRLA